MSNLQKKFKTEIIAKLQSSLGIKNPMAVPKIIKIAVNIGVKDALLDKNSLQKSSEALALLTGQKGKVTKAKKAIASFKLQKGDKIGLMVTLRGKRMYDFFEKLVNVVFPRLRDFHGIRREGFDSRGNYTVGFAEYTVFPEIDPGKVDKVQGLEVTVVTSAKDKKEGFELLSALGMPFRKV